MATETWQVPDSVVVRKHKKKSFGFEASDSTGGPSRIFSFLKTGEFY